MMHATAYSIRRGAMERGEGVGIHMATLGDGPELGFEDIGGAFAVFDAVSN
jgi:hypothetical protein